LLWIYLLLKAFVWHTRRLRGKAEHLRSRLEDSASSTFRLDVRGLCSRDARECQPPAQAVCPATTAL